MIPPRFDLRSTTLMIISFVVGLLIADLVDYQLQERAEADRTVATSESTSLDGSR